MATYNNIKKLKIGDNVYNLYDSGGTVTGMTTTAGAHTAGSQTVSGGIITTNIPTKTSHLTNDSGYITSDSDEKVKVTQYSQSTTYYPILATGIGTATRQIATNGISFGESGGGVTLDLGLDSNHWGILSLGGESQYKTTISGIDITANRSLTLPDKSGTIALTSDIPSVTDTKNTAGSTDTSSKIYLIGATSQAANPQTYSHDTAYVGTNGHLYSASKEVLVGGSNASSSVTITPSTTSVYSMSSTGSVTAGTAPSLSMAVDSTDTKKLNITFNAGTTPSTVTLPGRTQVSNLWNGYTAATAAAQTFTGKTS